MTDMKLAEKQDDRAVWWARSSQRAPATSALSGCVAEVVVIATSCLAVDASEDAHEIARAVVERCLAGYKGSGVDIRAPSWCRHTWEQEAYRKHGLNPPMATRPRPPARTPND